ncbi:MAG: MFS transporter [Polyangiaceae bacterium]|nr:MFS transporter [Polyangiaceae bacterium]
MSGGMRAFAVLWAGQIISILGSSLTSFALGVWVFQQTGSTTKFALIVMSSALGAMSLYPFAGAVVDRYDRRRLLFATTTSLLLATTTIGVLSYLGALSIVPVCIIAAVCAITNVFQSLTLETTTVMLVPPDKLGRAAGGLQMGFALVQIAGPALGGVLVGAVGVNGIVAIDLATFVFAFGGLLAIRIPSAPAAPHAEAGLRVGAGWWDAWRWLGERPGLAGVLSFMAVFQFSVAAGGVLATPLILSVASPSMLGFISSIGGFGALAGGFGLALLPKSGWRVRGVLGFGALAGIGLFLYGWRPAAPLFALASFLLMLSMSMVLGSNEVIWMTKVPRERQGRLFAVRDLVLRGMTPIACLVVGPLTDRVLEPLMASDGGAPSLLAAVFGTGRGRGSGVALALVGLTTLLSAALCYVYPRTRRVEEELPDALVAPDGAPAGGSEGQQEDGLAAAPVEPVP